ncbi:ESPR-type extended signal peptide-containing protein [Caballeronia sp. dw_19]|uniref:ESPR-type extended signal peptide-containing protein n=1 Tax=Caballeronia sp. dw_19 TaxID=2719791 RepID=UPI001BD2D794|nr:ESPR-type extended signal peptide-containing protein [Caballeronia sp. dw_19]
MNKSYKSVWNESTGLWVAVSELATGRSKSKRAKTAISKAILTQIAVGGMSLAGAGVAMADDTVKSGTNATVNIADGVAIGVNSEVDADAAAPTKIGGIAIGDSAYSMGSGVAVGQNSQASSDSLAFGSAAVAGNGGTAIGANAYTINNGGVAIGQSASATGSGAMAFGMNSSASGSGSVALGQDSVATDKNTISVGNATTQRQIANLAAGTHATDAVNLGQLAAAGLNINTSGVVQNAFVAYDSTAKTGVTLGGGTAGTKISNVAAGTINSTSKDAVNGSQLYATANSVATILGGSAGVNTDGTIKAPTYTVGGKTYSTLDSAMTATATLAAAGNPYVVTNGKNDGSDNAKVNSAYGIAIGSNAVVDTGGAGNDAIAIGDHATAGAYGFTGSTAVGGQSLAGGQGTALGYAATASGGGRWHWANRRWRVQLTPWPWAMRPRLPEKRPPPWAIRPRPPLSARLLSALLLLRAGRIPFLSGRSAQNARS